MCIHLKVLHNNGNGTSLPRPCNAKYYLKRQSPQYCCQYTGCDKLCLFFEVLRLCVTVHTNKWGKARLLCTLLPLRIRPTWLPGDGRWPSVFVCPVLPRIRHWRVMNVKKKQKKKHMQSRVEVSIVRIWASRNQVYHSSEGPEQERPDWAAAVQSETLRDKHHSICKWLIVIKLSGRAPH